MAALGAWPQALSPSRQNNKSVLRCFMAIPLKMDASLCRLIHGKIGEPWLLLHNDG
tara:strand:+ start:71 stop:238 length:168 start_codon:yes stop_codon:yes gene_type:complete